MLLIELHYMVIYDGQIDRDIYTAGWTGGLYIDPLLTAMLPAMLTTSLHPPCRAALQRFQLNYLVKA